MKTPNEDSVRELKTALKQTEDILIKWQSFPDDGAFTMFLEDEVDRLQKELERLK